MQQLYNSYNLKKPHIYMNWKSERIEVILIIYFSVLKSHLCLSYLLNQSYSFLWAMKINKWFDFSEVCNRT